MMFEHMVDPDAWVPGDPLYDPTDALFTCAPMFTVLDGAGCSEADDEDTFWDAWNGAARWVPGEGWRDDLRVNSAPQDEEPPAASQDWGDVGEEVLAVLDRITQSAQVGFGRLAAIVDEGRQQA